MASVATSFTTRVNRGAGSAGGRKAHDVTATATMAAAMASTSGMRPLVVRRGGVEAGTAPWRRTAWLR